MQSCPFLGSLKIKWKSAKAAFFAKGDLRRDRKTFYLTEWRHTKRYGEDARKAKQIFLQAWSVSCRKPKLVPALDLTMVAQDAIKVDEVCVREYYGAIII